MGIRDSIKVLGFILILGLSACSGGGNTGSGPLPQQPQQPPVNEGPQSTATQSYTLSSAAASYAIPSIGGYTGTVDFPAAQVQPDTTLTLQSSLPSDTSLSDLRRHVQSAGTLNIYHITTMTVSKTTTVPGFPGMTIVLPKTTNPAGLLFFYAIQQKSANGALQTFRTEGPATVSGQTIRIPSSLVPYTLTAHVPFLVELYSITPIPQSQGLWIANGTNVVEFIQGNLPLGVSNTAPVVSINSPVFGAPQGVVFDKVGNLWVIDGGTTSTGGTVPPSLYRFAASQLANLHKVPAPMPSITIRSSKFKFIQQAVFDRNGNLWVTDNGNNAVFEFDTTQLSVGGANVTPHTTIVSTPAFTGPLGIVFGANGNLWIANNGTTTLFEFKKPKLPTSGVHTLVPDVILSDDGHGSIQGPWALIFDTAGNLWSSNANAPDTIVEFAHSQLATTGSPTPTITISPATVKGNLTLTSPNGIAFDNQGDLAGVSSLTPFGVPIYGPAQLKTGKIVPLQFIIGGATTLNAPAGNVYGPAVP